VFHFDSTLWQERKRDSISSRTFYIHVFALSDVVGSPLMINDVMVDNDKPEDSAT
jgi:hypothetical protein